MHEAADAADAGRQVVGGEVGEVVEEAGADQGAEGGRPEPDGSSGEVEGRDVGLAVGTQVVTDHEGSVRPADKHRAIEV